MTEREKKELMPKAKEEVAAQAEQLQPGPIFTPDVDIFETDREIMLIADMPGVKSEDVHVELHEGVLTLSGDIAPWEGPDETDILIEYEVGRFYRQFAITEDIDQEKIDARMADGVLRLALPKAESAVTRKIPITEA